MKILFVDKKAILLDGITNLLTKSAHELVEKAHTIDEALEYFSDVQFDILITDFNIIDDNGLKLIRQAKKIYPKLNIIVLSMHAETHLIRELLKVGINKHALKKVSHQHLADVLESTGDARIVLNESINQIITSAQKKIKKDKLLTGREQEILTMISNEYNSKEIAERLTIAEVTVEKHTKSIYKKTKTSSVIGLLKFAYANNLIN